MLGVVFLKYVKITRKGEDSQGKFEYSECKEIKKQLVLIVAEKKTMGASKKSDFFVDMSIMLC